MKNKEKNVSKTKKNLKEYNLEIKNCKNCGIAIKK